ncbi:TraR/DksA family transcriptional regulator [Streptomyces sp. NPDC058001]|uniref:TraR/DksA family transcriptional regulator n=1 Tax=Streptomyces sp. NPDC058001 TaxID=3346300 RepID=UPI0036EC8779
MTGGPVTEAGPSPDDLAALTADLREQRAFRLDQLKEYARPTPPAGADSGSRDEVRAQLAASARMVLSDVEAALARLESGRYGRCERCARPVPVQRLRIVPQARYCARCQQAGESGKPERSGKPGEQGKSGEFGKPGEIGR